MVEAIVKKLNIQNDKLNKEANPIVMLVAFILLFCGICYFAYKKFGPENLPDVNDPVMRAKYMPGVPAGVTPKMGGGKPMGRDNAPPGVRMPSGPGGMRGPGGQGQMGMRPGMMAPNSQGQSGPPPRN